MVQDFKLQQKVWKFKLRDNYKFARCIRGFNFKGRCGRSCNSRKRISIFFGRRHFYVANRQLKPKTLCHLAYKAILTQAVNRREDRDFRAFLLRSKIKEITKVFCARLQMIGNIDRMRDHPLFHYLTDIGQSRMYTYLRVPYTRAVVLPNGTAVVQMKGVMTRGEALAHMEEMERILN